ncbi:MAG: hypothetical protein KGJ57_08570 [Sphingomonadales bacterium]|nr:hypothetical protein [Sphingomonadales bacterium]MDE2169463.1 hypothetical protein [Sphingomonadales bacterium]
MKAHFGKFALIVVTSSLALGGCATTGSVKRAQARADQAFVEGQKGQADAARAQGTADSAMGAAQHAQGTADQAGAAAQNAGTAAAQANQAAATAAQGNSEQIAALSSRLHRLEAAEWRRKHPHKKHHHHKAPKKEAKQGTDQVTFHK